MYKTFAKSYNNVFPTKTLPTPLLERSNNIVDEGQQPLTVRSQPTASSTWTRKANETNIKR